MAGFFNYSKAGQGVRKEDLEKSGLGLYFDILGRRLWKLMTLNLMYIAISIPAIIIAYIISTYLLSFFLSLPKEKIEISEISDVIKIITMFMTVILFQFFGSGPATASMTYILKTYVKDTHVWIFSDFFEQFKKNFKQGLAVYLINTFVSFALIVAYIFYSFIMRNSLGDILAFVIIITAAFFTMMQMYTYQLMAGFDFKVKDIYKNSLLLTMIKLPWNILTAALIFVFMYAMYSIYLTSPLIAIILFIVIYIVLVNFTQIFMTNNIIKEYVLEPSLKKETEKSEE